MDDTDSIMTAVQTIFELVYTEFTKATEEQEKLSSTTTSTSSTTNLGTTTISSSSTSSSTIPSLSSITWTGLHPDAKHRIDIQARNEVNRLRTVFHQANTTLDTMEGLRLTKHELDDLFRKQQEQLLICNKLLNILPNNPDTITADSNEIEKYKEDINSIHWPIPSITSTNNTGNTTESTSTTSNANTMDINN